MKSKQRSREFWEKAVARAESGGKTRAQVAKELGVGVPALSYWVYKLRLERKSPTTLFWQRGGYVLYYKRLDRGRFKLPQSSDDQVKMTSTGLRPCLRRSR